MPEYLTLQNMIDNKMFGLFTPYVEEIYQAYQQLIETAWGSKKKHQAWPGGYIDHVHETLNLAICDYRMLDALRPLPFDLQDALLVLFLHDMEKPFRYAADGRADDALLTKQAKENFRFDIAKKHDIPLTPEHINALYHIEKEKDYNPDQRMMNELGAFCHRQDVFSARGWYDHPKIDDTWGFRFSNQQK